MTEIELFPRPPYNFHLGAVIFSGGDPAIRTYEQGVFRQALEIEGQPFRIGLEPGVTKKDPLLILSVFPDPDSMGVKISIVRDVISSIFNIDDDLVPFYRMIENDPVMNRLSRQLEGLKAPTTMTVFEALTDSVIEQQISLKVAHGIQNRLIRAVGTRLHDGSTIYYCYPSPDTLARTPQEMFRECGMSTRKGEYIREISSAIVSGDLDLEAFRSYADTEQIIEELIKIRGIGKWTAELTILRGIHKLDAFPADDVALRRIMSRFYKDGQKMSADEARIMASELWDGFKGLAAFYLEIADHTGITP